MDEMRLQGATSRFLYRGLFLLCIAIAFLASQSLGATYYWNHNSVLTNDKDFSRSYNWTVNANGTGAFAPSSNDDDFTSGTMDPVWHYIDQDNSAVGSADVTTNSGKMSIKSRGTDVYGTTNEGVFLYRSDIHGNFFASVKIESQTNTSSSANAGFLIANDMTNLSDGGFFELGMTPGGVVQFVYDQTGTQGQLDNFATAGSGLGYPIWLAVAKNGLNVTAYYKTAVGNAWTQIGTAQTSQNTRMRQDVALYATAHNTTTTCTVVFDDFAGGGPINSGFDLSLNGSGANADANATLGSADISANSLDFTGYTGTLKMGGQNGLFGTYYSNASLTGTSVARVDTAVNFDWGGGSPDAGIASTDNYSASWEGFVVPNYSETYTFYSDHDDGARLWVNNVLILDTYGTCCGERTSSTIALTAGVRYAIHLSYTESGGNASEKLRWSSATSQIKEIIPKRSLFAGKLTITGTGTSLNMAAGTVTAQDGWIDFAAPSGTQTFVPRSGQTMPNILHSGAGTLQLSTNALTTLGFFQGAGTFDFNSLNVTTAASGTNRGDFQIWNGGTSSFANLGGRTVTVVGNTSITGSNGSLVNLNPGSAWTLNTTGRLTVDYGNLGNCNASGTAGLAFKTTDAGSNSSWTIKQGTFYWNRNDVINTSLNINRIYNWTSNADGTGYRPETSQSDKFESQTLNAGWIWKDLDNSDATGSYALSGGQLLMSARGADVYGASNEFVTFYRTDLTTTGDVFDVTVKITAQSNSDVWGKAGLIMANDFSNLTSGGYAFMAVTPGNNFSFQADVAAPTGQIDPGGTGGGVLTFPCWIRLVRNGNNVSGYYRTSQSNAWTQSNSTVVPAGIAGGTASQVGLFVCSHNTGTTMSVAFDDLEGGGNYMSATDNDLSFNGTGAASDANSQGGGDLLERSIDFTNYTGTFDLGGWNMTLNAGNATFVSGMTLTTNGGGLFFTAASGTQVFTPKSGATYDSLSKSGAGTLQIATNGFTGGDVTQSGGTLDWGTGLSHTVASIATSGSGTMTVGTSGLTINTGKADFSGLGTLNVSAGSSLTFSAATGTQVFTPKSGSTHPAVTKAGAGTLQLSTNPLIARAFTLSGGTLDFNGQNLTTNNSGNFAVTNGTSASFANLGGRTLTVAGSSSFAGTAGSLLDANPATAWTITSTGALTASYAYVANSNASASTSTGVATNSINQGGNLDWNFPTTDFSAWTYTSQINFNTTATGANITNNLTNFPLLVRLDSNNFIFPQADPAGKDIRFADPDGNILSYEIGRWDATLKKAEIWVMVPQIDANSDRDYIDMYWGNSAATALSSGSAVFNSGMNWKGVWHLNQSGAQPSFSDASATGNTATGQGVANGDTSTAIIGYGYKLDGSSKFLTSSVSYSNPGTFTTSCWFKTTTTSGGKLIGFGSSQTGGSGNYDRHTWMDNTGKLNFGVYNGAIRTVSSTSAYNDGAWHLVTSRFGASGEFLYVDGIEVASNASITTAENTTGYWRAGYDNIGGSWTPVPTSFYFNGTLDEVRINHSEQSADWIKFSYYNQKQNSAILSYSNSALSTWSYSSKVYVNTTASGANITADQTSFPLLVRLTQGNFDFTQAKSDGGDLRFTDSTGALLPYEIERFDATNKLADVWVLMPAIKANNNSQWFKMYWGKATATSLSSAASVFQAGNGFLGAWHLHNGSFSDATSYGNTLVNSSTTNQSAANIAGGRTFSSAYMTSPALSLGGTFTVSAWVKPGTPSDIITICSNGNNGANSNGFRFFVNSSATTNGTIHFETGNGAASASTVSASGQVAFAGSWYHLTAVVNRTAGTAVLYNNGVQVVSGTVRTDFGNTAAWTFGKMSTVTFPWVGDEDEPEVSTTLRSADWIKLSYESQKSGSTVVSLGSRPFDFAKSVRFNFNTTATGANVATNVTGIPILVNLSSSNFDFSVTTNSGNDIQFVDKDGTYLYHDVVEWDKANGIGRVWVRVPQVDGNSLADFITLYYGCATCTASPYDVSDSVFSAYRCAYHLNGSNENKGTDATKYKNHLSYTNDVALSAGLTTPLAPYFDGSTGSTGSYAYVNDPAGGELDVGTGDFTIMGWAKTSYTPAASTWVTPFGKENNVSARYGYGMIFDQAGAGGGKAYFEIWSNNTQIKSPLSASALNDGAWHFLVGKKTAAAVELFVDGATRGTTAHALGTLDNAIPFTAGGDNIGSRFQGNVNEVAMAASALSADFIKLSYENQKAGGTLFSSTTFTTASFQKSKVFKLNTSASGANIAGDVYNFPLLLRISGNAVGTATPITDLTQSAGQDIRFLDGDGVTWLDYQIERWDPTAGVDSAEVWVKVPRIYGNSTSNTITMYYQQAASVSGNMPDGQCASCVFSPSNGFAAAWHLNQAGNNTAANYVDATGNGSNGTGVNMVAGTQVSALSAQGQTFNGSSQYINVPSSGTAVAINNKSFTLSGWFNRTSAGTDQYVITQGTGATDNGLHFGFRSTNVLTLGFYSDDLNSTNTYATTGTWQYLTGTFDLATKARKLYINGTLDISGTANGAYAGTGDMYLAHNLWGGGYSPGTLDEFSVTTVVRDSNWIKLSYQNQRRDAAPLFNPSIADFQKSKKYVFNTTKTGANVLNDVTDYPVLVRFTDADGGLLSLVQGGAPDIRFLDGDGKTWLNYQVERWSTATSPDSAEIWVRVPKVDGNSDHDFITMYYQQSSVATVADGQCASCVFDTANGFASTWHLNNTLNDITINANNGTNQGSIDGEGVSSSGRSFSGTAQYATFGNGNSLKNITDDITVEAWLRTSQAAAANKSIIRHGGHFTALQVNSASTAMITRWDGGGGASTTITWSPTFNDGTWQHYVSQYNKTTGHKVYRNGSLYYSDATVTGSLVTTGTAAFALGGTEVGGELYNGKLDEVRVYDVAKDSNWIRLDYETQRRTGNLFWNTRVSPNNQATLTATAVAPGNISLSWTTPVSDSSNSDSVGLWVKYTAFPDSANAPAASAGSATHVANLVKTDSAYTYPATYPGTYYFALAVRNTNGKWSPFTTSSSDTANLGSFFFGDTVYVDSAIGSDANTCAQAQNPATPKLTISSAVTNCTASDTLVVRVMPGTYANDNSFTKNAGVLRANIVSFDNNSRAILNGSGSVTENGRTWNYTVALNDDITLRQMDIRAAANGHLGIYTRNNADSVTIDGNRIYNSGANVYDTAIGTCNSASEYMLIMNNVIYQPNVYGIEIHTDNRTNIINNVFYGSGGASKGIYMGFSALDEKFTISNNIFYNWNYGIHTLDANNEIGVVSNNLFFLVTTGQEVVGETDAAKVLKDPLFANTAIGNPNAFKLLPGSPAIDAGTATISTGGAAHNSITPTDQFGSARTIGSAPDIGVYEGTGYTPNPTGEFDSLITTSTATTVTVYNSKWKVVFDKAKGGGISEFYDQTAPASNLLAAGTVLFDDKVGATSASSQSSIAPTIVEQSISRVVVRQRFAYSASLDVNFYYTVYPSGHIYIQTEYANLSSGSLSMTTIDYTLKVNSAVAAYNSVYTAVAGYTNSVFDGYGYVTTATRDALLSMTRPLNDGSQSAEVWTGTQATGASGNVVMKTADMVDMPRYYKRYHHFLLYIGDANLDFAKASVINADVSNPSVLTATSGSLIHERSWQDNLGGHWTFDEGAGAVARDKSINYTNNGTITGAKYVSGKINAALTFTSSDVVVVGDADQLEAAANHTYMFWLKPNFASGSFGSDGYILSKGQNSTDGWNVRRITSTSAIRFRMGAATVDSPVLTDGVWTHFAVVADGDGILRMYINGVLQAVSTTVVAPAFNASTLRIGENDVATAANRFVGDIDDVRIYLANEPLADIQSIYNRGFSQRAGNYGLRADNNNRMVALINGGAAQTRVQPAFQVDNWFGPATPKYVYLNGTRLAPNTDFSSSLIASSGPEGSGAQFGSRLTIQLNKNLTGADQTLFIDDDDSTGYMGSAAQMKTLAVSVTANDKITLQNFSGSTFGGPASGQWYLELDLNGWTTWNTVSVVDQGFGEFNVWKDAAINPNVAVSGSTNQVGIDDRSGRTLTHMKFDDTGNKVFSSGVGYAGPANIGYTLTDSSATRISMTLANMSMQGSDGTFTLSKRWTVYPTGRIFGSFVVSGANFDMDDPALDLQCRFNNVPTKVWDWSTADNNMRWGWMGGDLDLHSFAGGITTLKRGGTIQNVSNTLDGGTSVTIGSNAGGTDYRQARLSLQNGDFTQANNPQTLNFFVDISRNFTDSATADSLTRDVQNPAVITAITGTRTTNDALDFNADNFAEGDGAYTYAAAGGIAHFKFVNSVATFNPAFRINTWTYGTLPEVVIVDNQILTRGYGYNAYLNTAGNGGGEVVLQFNKTLVPGNHVIFISHKTGLAVTLRTFEAKGGDGVDTLTWTTESEFENLGYNVYRRLSASQIDSAFAEGSQVAGAGIANALMNAARTELAAKAAAKLAAAQAAAGDSTLDTIPSQRLTPEELAVLGYVRINPKLVAGAKGGSAATTQAYRFIDRTAAYDVAYDYLLESVDFNGNREQFGPRTARPANPLTTELYSNYPNPFNPITTLRFSLRDKIKVSLVIYDSKGRLVRTLIRPDKLMAPGKYRLIWDAKNEGGVDVPSGQYFYRFTAARYVKTRKMILVK